MKRPLFGWGTLVIIALAILIGLTVHQGPVADGANGDGQRVVLVIHSIEAIDELEGVGDDPDLLINVWVNDDLVMELGPYDDQNPAIVHEQYEFYCETTEVDLVFQVLEKDLFDDDEVDISGDIGGGKDNVEEFTPGAIFWAIHDLSSKEFFGDPVETEGEWYVTSGDFDGSVSVDENDGAVYFSIEANTEARMTGQSPEESSVTLEEGEEQTFSIDVEDEEGDTIRIKWWTDDYLYEDIVGTSFAILTSSGSAGSYIVSCEAYEGAAKDPFALVTWSLTVNEYNSPPVALIEAPSSADVFETVVFSGSDAYDPDSNHLDYEWRVDGEYAGDKERLYYYFLEPGQHEVVLEVYDGEKTNTATHTITIGDVEMPQPTETIEGEGSSIVTTDYEYDLKMTNSWSLRVTGCEDYTYYIKVGIWCDLRVSHDGTSELSFESTETTTDVFDLGTVLSSSTDAYSVEFKPTLYISIEKRYTDGRATGTPLDARMPFPSLEDADGDGSNITVGGYKIYLWDSWVEIYSLDSTDSLGDVFEYDYRATLAEIDILNLVEGLASGIPHIKYSVKALNMFVDVMIEFNLNIGIWFSEDLIVFNSLDEPEDCAVVNFYDPSEKSNEDEVANLVDGDVVYTALNTYMDSDVSGSIDLVVDFTYVPIITDFINFIMGKEKEEFRYSLLKTDSLYGSTEGFGLLDYTATFKDDDDDNDGVKDASDAYPNDPAASVDSDGDGFPDEWNPGRSAEDSTSDPKLALDAFPDDAEEWMDTDGDGSGDNGDDFPTDPAASLDTDGDGHPDEWNAGSSKDDSTTGLKIDQFPANPKKWKKEGESPSVGLVGVLAAIGVIAGVMRRRYQS